MTNKNLCIWYIYIYIYSYFEKGCRKKCARDNPERKHGIWSIHCSWRLKLSNLFVVLSFSTRKHISTASSAILSNFFEEKWTQNHPQYLLGLSRALFPTTFLEIAVYKCNDMHLQNTTTITYRLTGMFINEAIIGTFGCIKHLFHHHRYSYFQFKNSFTPQL